MSKNRSYIINLFVCILFITFLGYIHYFIERYETTTLLLSYSALFILYLYFLKGKIFNWKEIIVISIVARLVLFFGLPNLSDDFYRFIWDGWLLDAGINPFQHIPEYYTTQLTKVNGLTNELYQLLNSKAYFTVYPPISQLIFWLSVKLNPTSSIFGSVIIIRSIILLFEIGSLYLIYKILELRKKPFSQLSIYALNPLVILELTGNLHFEGIMLFFLLLSIYLFYRGKNTPSAIAIAASIAAKLTPLMLLPVFIKKTSGFFKYYTVTGLGLIILFLPMVSNEFINGLSSSLSLFFKSFEFNGGLFFLLREIGFYLKGYDIIQTLGPVMSIASLLIILCISFFVVSKESSLEGVFIIIFFCQLFFATTVHPWYIIPMIALSCSIQFKFPLVWSFLIFLTYAGYSHDGFEHPFLLITFEYTIVSTFAFFEIYQYLKNQKSLNTHE